MASGTFTQANEGNTFVKDHRASGKMVVGYSRNPKEFALPRYCQFKKVSKSRGYYLQVNQFNAARIVGSNLNQFVWPDGQPRPALNNNGVEFRFVDFETVRRNFGHNLGSKAVDQADFDLVGLTEDDLASKAMLARSIQAHAVLANAANYDAGHRVDTTTIPGSGLWSNALSTTPFIQKAINFAANRILRATVGKVKKKDLLLTISPTTANTIAETQELRDHIKQSPQALAQVKGEGEFSEWGLPNQLYGVNLNVDDTVKVTSPRDATVVTEFVCPDATAYITARVGGLDAPRGGPTFSTLMCFAYEEMTVERKRNMDDRLVENNVVDDVVVVMAAPASGFCLFNLY